jgi:hypothetical protein
MKYSISFPYFFIFAFRFSDYWNSNILKPISACVKV